MLIADSLQTFHVLQLIKGITKSYSSDMGKRMVKKYGSSATAGDLNGVLVVTSLHPLVRTWDALNRQWTLCSHRYSTRLTSH